MKNIIITGGNGYIGSHMARLMHGNGYGVHIIDNFSTSPNRPVHNYGEFHNFDIADTEKVEKLLEETRPEAVFHFAARAIVSESQENPLLYYDEVLRKSSLFIESCVKKNVGKFIFSSTCATFGEVDVKVIDEDLPQNPVNTYGQTKLMVEMILKDLANKGKIKACALRYFNAAGCASDSSLGENHEPETHLIPNLCLSGLSGNREFSIFGSDHDTEDGTCVRDYIHVEDLVIAHELAFNYLDKSEEGWNHFNLGTGKGYSVKEVLETFEKVTGVDLVKLEKPARAGDPAYLVASKDKSKSLLGFEPKRTLEESLTHTWNWFKERRKEFID